VGGCLTILIGLALALQAQQTSERGIKTMTEGELGTVEDPLALLGTWIAYHSPQTIETGTQLEYRSAVRKEKIHSRFVLVRVGKGWMIAEVVPKFAGQHYVGEIKELSQSPLGEKALQDIRRRRPDETRTLLPCYLHAVKTLKVGTRSRYISAGAVAFFGLLFAAFSMKMLTAKPQMAA
jgi:hypothetical protein